MPTTRAATVVYHRGVSFLVEGLSVDVPQTLLDKFPDTKLAKLAMGSQVKDDEPIAIDVDLLHFRYMIEYMRNGEKVTLAHPGIVDKESLMTTLDNFGFQDTSDLTVVNPDTSFGSAVMHAKKHLEVLNAEHKSREKALWNDINTATTAKEREKHRYKSNCLYAAQFLFFEHLKTNELHIDVPEDPLEWHFHHYFLETIYAYVYNGEHNQEDESIKFMVECCNEDSELRNYHQDCMMLYGFEYEEMNVYRGMSVLLKPSLKST